jgi:sulfofructose kinase
MGSAEKVQVVGLGQACVDYLGRLPFFPQEDQKGELLEIHKQCGGPASTALVTLSRAGVKTSFLGSISDDAFGFQILEGLREDQIDFSHLKITPGYTSQFAFIAINKNTGTRTIFWHRGSVPHLRAGDVDLSPFRASSTLHLDGLMVEASIEAARQARSLGWTVVMDAGTMRQGSMELIPLVDVLIASEGFAESLVGVDAGSEEALKALRELGPGKVVITLGAKGSIGWDGEKVYFQKAYPVKPVDTTGAGDVYHGAYIFGMLQRWPMQECMRFASAVAALKCREVGARKGIPRLEEVKEFMNRFPDIQPLIT